MEEIKKAFIVDEKEFDNTKSEDLVRQIVDMVKVTNDGKVLFDINSMKNTDKIGLCIVARFLANKLERSIPSEVALQEIISATDLPIQIVNARISELIEQRFIRRVKSGTYIAIPYKIEDFIKKVEKRYGNKDG
jgi:hypothetical protein